MSNYLSSAIVLDRKIGNYLSLAIDLDWKIRKKAFFAIKNGRIKKKSLYLLYTEVCIKKKIKTSAIVSVSIINY